MLSDSGDKLPPLPPTAYPRVVPRKRRTIGFYLVAVVVTVVWAVTPLSYVYLGWYIYSGRLLPGRDGVLATLVAGWALVEAVFGIYYQYLARKVQPIAPPSAIRPEQLSDLFLRVLHAGLAYSAPGDKYVREMADRERHAAVCTHPNAQANRANYPQQATEANGRLAPPGANGSAGANENGNGNGTADDDPPHLRKRGRLYSAASQNMGITEQFLDPEEQEDPLFDESGNPHQLDKMDPLAIEFREQLRTWFHHVPWEDIRRDDVLTWLAWSCFNQPLEDVQADPKRDRFLERTYTMLEARTGTKFLPGCTGLKVMRLTLDPVNVVSRPFFIYAIANSINFCLQNYVYPSRGVKLYRHGNIDYFVRIPPGWTPEKGMTERNCVPIVYLHGLGFGLLQNHLLIKHLVHSLPTHPLLVPMAYHTAQEIFNPRHLQPWTRPELVNMLRGACQRWGFWEPGLDGRKGRGGVSLLSHSNGSVHHGWVLKDAPELARRSCFVDPVVFSLWEGDVCFSFCYRKPRKAIELALYYFVASEVGIANYIQRHFNWCDNTLFVEEIPNARDATRSAYFLGGRDIIVDAERVRRYLVRSGVTRGLHWDAAAGHGDGLLGEARDRVVMYVGTGSTRGWQGWLTRGRRSHSLGQYQRPQTPQQSDTEGGRGTPTSAEAWQLSREALRQGLKRRKTGL